MDFWAELMNFLNQHSADPLTYCLVFFLYAVLATIALPIPVEIGLIINPNTDFIIKALVLGAGKAVGSVLVFLIGTNIEWRIRNWSSKWGWFRWFVDKSEILVEKLGYIGLYLLLSIPGMVDTVPVYVFSVFNRQGEVLQLRYFVVANFAGGITRALVLYALFYGFGINLFGQF
ncbi:MAG: hypothetical protein QW083_00420 [Methanomassiliicoccales archaeon]